MVDTDLVVIKYNGESAFLFIMQVSVLSEILLACKELIADAKIGCVDLVFKDVCLDILAKARLVLNAEQFEELTVFVTENLKEEKASVSGIRV
jgi:hypothetical protein